MTTRRDFLQLGTGSMLAAALPSVPRSQNTAAPATFLDLLRGPDSVMVRTATGDQTLRRQPVTRWVGEGVEVHATAVGTALRVELSAPSTGVIRVGLRWKETLHVTHILGDAWERGYGDLEWRGYVPDRVMPWYVMAWDGQRADGYGVRTGANALCFWQVDPEGITLWADVRSGGTAVQLGNRTLQLCEVVCRPGIKDESAFQSLHKFCVQMCDKPRLPAMPVYGSNDWYWAYGKNSAASAIADAERIVALSPTGNNRPFVVIDDGWQPGRGTSKDGAGNWDRGNENFPDLPGLAARVRGIGGRMGAWIRPLEAATTVPDSWRLSRDKKVLDPTVPAVAEKVRADMARLRSWGMELIKHDYSTWDIFGRWGNTMGSTLTRDGWTFAEGPRRTTAEVINAFYQTIRTGAGDALVIGCNTMSHLSAGVFELCRIGDDTSGTEWARTRRMGVNTLAFRGAQHGTFYAADGDCAAVTKAVPWEKTQLWLGLLAASGTPLFVSLEAAAMGAEQNTAVRKALALASRPQTLLEPGDWMANSWPALWERGIDKYLFQWGNAEG